MKRLYCLLCILLTILSGCGSDTKQCEIEKFDEYIQASVNEGLALAEEFKAVMERYEATQEELTEDDRNITISYLYAMVITDFPEYRKQIDKLYALEANYDILIDSSFCMVMIARSTMPAGCAEFYTDDNFTWMEQHLKSIEDEVFETKEIPLDTKVNFCANLGRVYVLKGDMEQEAYYRDKYTYYYEQIMKETSNEP